MKRIKFIALLLVVCMFPIALFGCNSERVSYKVTVSGKVEGSSENLFGPIEITIEQAASKATPVVLDALADALHELGMASQLKYTEDEMNVAAIGDKAEAQSRDDDGNVTDDYFWEFNINGEKPSGRAGTVEITDGDVIEFVFVHVKY